MLYCKLRYIFFIECRLLLHPEGGAKDVIKAGLHYNHLIPKQVMDELLTLRKFKAVHEKHVRELINANQIDASEVQGIMDETRISFRGYSSLYKSSITEGYCKEEVVFTSQANVGSL